MDCKELRIGNLVKYYTGHSTEIGLVDIDMLKQHGILQPIDITEEWLLRFGFEIKKSERHECWWQIRKGNFWMQKIQGDDFYSTLIEYDHNSSDKIGNVKYVHQLQNLYFDLTGEEL